MGEAKKGGLFTATISDSDTTRCPFIMVISLPAMSVVIATPHFKLIVPRPMLPRVANALTSVHSEAATDR